MHHARDVCEGICNRMILHLHIIAFGDDGTGPADETRPGMVSSNYGREAFVVCNTITL